MFGSSMLDIAIGVVFVYLLLSVFATAVNEIILSAFNLRGKYLLRGIATLLSDPKAEGLAEKVYNHGQVYGLYDGPFAPQQKKSNLPAYIPSRNFALALLASIEPNYGVAPPPPPAPAAPPPPAAANIPPAVPNAQPQAAQPPAAPAATAVHTVVVISHAFKDAVTALAGDPITAKVGKPLESMIAMAGNDANKLQKAVEDWYNSSMDRVSGWYKYRTQWVLFAIGIVMAVALNANTINIIRQLSKDSTMRQSIVAAAQSAKPPATGDDTINGQIQAARESMDSVNGLGIPLGWRSVPAFRTFPQRLRNPHYFAITLDRIFGWLLTAIAISLGAPFWFDALNKIMVVRSTVKPREKSPDEPSKS